MQEFSAAQEDQPNPAVRVQTRDEGNLCASCGGPLPEKPSRKDRRHCSPVCRIKGYRARQGTLDLGGSGVGVGNSSSRLTPGREGQGDEVAARQRSGNGTAQRPQPQSLPDVQHYSPDMGQSATKDEGRRVSSCLRIMAVLLRDRLRWWRYDDLGLAAGVRLGSVRTRCSNLRNAKPPVDFEERVVDGFREIRLGVAA